MIDIGMCGDQASALRDGEIHLPDHLNDLIDGLFVANVDEPPVAIVVHEINVAAHAPPGLMVHLNHAWENRASFEHRSGQLFEV